MKKNSYLIFLLLVLATACTKTTQDIESSLDIPVIESFLSPDNEVLVRLTTAIPYSSDTTLYIDRNISGINIYLTTDEESYVLTEITDSAGYYKDMTRELRINENRSYNIEFQYKENKVSGNTYVPLKPENFETSETTIAVPRITENGGMGMPNMTEIELSWDDPNNDYYLIYIQYLEDNYDTINTIVEIDDAAERANFSSEPIQNNVYIIRSMQFMFFGEYRLVLCRITEDYAKLYETLSQSSLEGLAEPPTNIENGKGIFAAFNSDTLTVNVVED